MYVSTKSSNYAMRNKKKNHQPDTPPTDNPSPPTLRTASAYCLRPRNRSGQVVSKSPEVHDVSVSSNEQLLSRCRDSMVVLEDISHLCETVQSSNENSQVANHSADSLLAKDKNYLNSLPERSEIAWPSMNDNCAWSLFEESVMRQLPPASNGLSVGARIQFLEDTLYDCASSAFGQKSPSSKQAVSHFLNNKDKVIKLVKTKNNLLIQIDLSCNPVEQGGLRAFLEETRLKLRHLRRKENRRRRSFLRKQQRRSFKNNPYKCGKNLLTPRNFTKLSLPTDKLDEILKSLHSDPDKDTPLPSLNGLPDSPSVKVKFDTSSFSAEEYDAVIRSRRNGSRPGPNQIPYKVYKKCSEIAKYLYHLCLDCLRLKRVPLQWRVAYKTFIPKVEKPDPGVFSDFRDISLLNVEGKIFFSLISKRFYRHIVVKNKFIDTSVQKGCMENIPGCWEHIAMIWDSLKDARLNQKDLVAIWLDIANAYGSISHQLIFLALRRYGIPKKWISIIEKYYHGLWSKSMSENAKSSWHRHEKGIFTGCCISIILFLAGMNIIIEYICNTDVEGFRSSSNVLMPLIRGFMDDLNLLTVGVKDAQTLLGRASEALTWARMEWRLKKSRYLVLLKGRVPADELTSTSFVGIPSIAVKPVRCLGKNMDSSIRDSKGSVKLEEAIVDGLNKLDRSFLLGTSKVWILQFLLLQRIRWTIMIYEIPLTTVERFEQRISKFIRKWLGFHPTISSLALYSKSSPCPLPFTSLTSLFKTSKVSAHLQLRDSKDPVVSSSVPVLKTGKKWSVSESVQDAESILHFKKILGHTQSGTAGLGFIPIEQIPVKGSKEYRKAVADTVANVHDQIVLSSQDGKYLQLNWNTWSRYVRNDLSWKCIWAFGPQLLRFCVQSCFNTLPSPNNCVRWNLSEDKSCVLCRKPLCTLPHILSGCKFSKNNGRWNYRHDSVLKVLLEGLEELIQERRSEKSFGKSSSIKFVKQGHSKQGRTKKSFGLLEKARDWILLADIGACKLLFPSEIFSTSERPDIVLYSKSTTTVILIENTSGCEENMSERHTYKVNHYNDLVNAIEANGWVCHFFAIEVCARGYNSSHVPFCLKSLGFTPKSVKSLLGKMSRASLEASYHIWLARKDKGWNPPLIDWKTSFGPQTSSLREIPHTVPPREKVRDDEVSDDEQIDFVITPIPPLQTHVKPVTVNDSRGNRPSEKSGVKPAGGRSSDPALKVSPILSPLSLDGSSKQLLPVEPRAESSDGLPFEQSLPKSPIGSSTSKPAVRILFRRPWLGLINLGNTCYANSILNCLFPFPELWDFTSRRPLHQALKAILMSMNVQPRDPSKATPLRPRKFLVALGNHMSNLQSRPFCYNQQHDASEVLGYVLDDLFSAGVERSVVCSSFATSYRCQACGITKPAFTNDVAESILNLEVCQSISTALMQRLSGSLVTRYCEECRSDQICVEMLSFINLPDILILRLRRDQFVRNQGGGRIAEQVNCDRCLTVGLGEGGNTPPATYHLVAVCHHTGQSLASGHFLTTLVDPHSENKWEYNDPSVSKTSALDPWSAYIFFYRKEKRR